jgi:hypothetical protein
MNNLLTLLKLLFNQNEPCPYWNFFGRRCMIDSGHSRGFENTEYCKHIDAISICLHYRKPKNE